MEPNSAGIKTWQWVVTVIVIIVLIIIGIMVLGGDKTEVPLVEDNTPAANTPARSVNRIVMADQYPGNVVYLSSVQFENPGWVVIRKDNKGQPGAVIGSAYFEKGINTGRINLTEPMTDGSIYYAVMHKDDGDKKFDATKDAELKDANGSVIMKTFRATTAATEELKG